MTDKKPPDLPSAPEGASPSPHDGTTRATLAAALIAAVAALAGAFGATALASRTAERTTRLELRHADEVEVRTLRRESYLDAARQMRAIQHRHDDFMSAVDAEESSQRLTRRRSELVTMQDELTLRLDELRIVASESLLPFIDNVQETLALAVPSPHDIKQLEGGGHYAHVLNEIAVERETFDEAFGELTNAIRAEVTLGGL